MLIASTAAAAAAKSLQSCPTLCDPLDGSPPGSSAHGILQARILEWVDIAFSICYTDYYISNKMIMVILLLMQYQQSVVCQLFCTQYLFNHHPTSSNAGVLPHTQKRMQGGSV